MSDETAPVIELVERVDGTKLIRDRSGTEVNLTVAERKLDEHRWKLTLSRSSRAEREFQADLAARAGRYLPIGNDPQEPIDLVLLGRDWGTHRFTMTQREVPLSECVTAVRDLLADYGLL